MLKEFEYAHKMEPVFGSRDKAEVFVSASIEAKRSPSSFIVNKIYWIDSFKKSGFSEEHAEKLFDIVQYMFLEQ